MMSSCIFYLMKKIYYQIGELAKLSGVSIRMLRHYDKLKLLVPSHRSAANYRRYSESDLLRLQQIMIARTLGLALEDIRILIDDPHLDRRKLLIQQRQELSNRAQLTAQMIRSVDAAIALLNEPIGKDKNMNKEQLFNGFEADKYADAAQREWGATSAYTESTRRVSKYNAKDFQVMKAENAAIMNSAMSCLQAGVKATDKAVMDIAEQHRLSIDRWFYPCSRFMHASLADMYESDQRFADSINKFGAGLTPYLATAIRANAKRKIEKAEG